MSQKFEFTNRSLKAFYLHLKKIAPIIPFREAPHMTGGFTILRHDVDMDIYPAHLMGKLEKQIGIKSSFFIMTTSHHYNPLSRENKRLLKEMIDDGHEIGLHFDPAEYIGYSEDALREMADYESRILESITNQKVKSLSLHNPAEHGNYVLIKGYINAYDSLYFSPDKYISDSYMHKSFENRCPYEFMERAKHGLVQILLHPCQFTEEGKTFRQICDDYLERIKTHTDSTFRNLIGNI